MTAVSQAVANAIATSTAQKSSSTSSTSSTSNSSSSTSSANGVLGENDFLTLLITQLQNQDPLNPDDPTAFTAQLAQFSSLEQMYNLNDSMKNLVSSTNNSSDMSALGMIGKSVTYSGSSLSYSGDPVQVGYNLDSDATQVQVLIKDSSGQTVRTLEGSDLTAGNHLLTWDGLDQSGNSMSDGTYNIVVQATGSDGSSVTASPLITSEVTGVDLSGSDGAILDTQAGTVNLSDILGVGSSGSSGTSIFNQSTTSDSSNSITSAAESALASSAAQSASNSTNSLF